MYLSPQMIFRTCLLPLLSCGSCDLCPAGHGGAMRNLRLDQSAASAATVASGFPPPPPAPPCGCDRDPIEGLRRLFVDVFQSGALARGRDPATRPVFLRLHGVAHASLAVCADLPEHLRVGV